MVMADKEKNKAQKIGADQQIHANINPHGDTYQEL